MRIAIISTAALPSPPSQYGGIEAVAWDLADVLGSMKNDVTLIATQGSQKPTNANLITTTNPETEQWQEQTALNYYAHLLPQFDIVHDMSHQKFAGFLIYEQQKAGNKDFQKIKYLANTHTVNLPPLPQATPNVTCLSKYHADYITRRFGVETKHVYNGINPLNFIRMKKKAKTDRFIFIGRPNPEKGALKAIELAKKANVPLDVIAGRLKTEPIKYAVEVARACKLGSPWVYHGETDHQKKNYILARAKCLIFPLQWDEPFGLTVIEAMMSNTPVIAYKRAAMPELIEDGKTGFLVNDDNEFIDAMKKIDEIDIEYCGEYARKKFSREAMAQNWLNLYNQILKGDEW